MTALPPSLPPSAGGGHGGHGQQPDAGGRAPFVAGPERGQSLQWHCGCPGADRRSCPQPPRSAHLCGTVWEGLFRGQDCGEGASEWTGPLLVILRPEVLASLRDTSQALVTWQQAELSCEPSESCKGICDVALWCELCWEPSWGLTRWK